MGAHDTAHIQRSENFVKTVLSSFLLYTGAGAQTQIVRLVWQGPLSAEPFSPISISVLYSLWS